MSHVTINLTLYVMPHVTINLTLYVSCPTSQLTWLCISCSTSQLTWLSMSCPTSQLNWLYMSCPTSQLTWLSMSCPTSQLNWLYMSCPTSQLATTCAGLGHHFERGGHCCEPGPLHLRRIRSMIVCTISRLIYGTKQAWAGHPGRQIQREAEYQVPVLTTTVVCAASLSDSSPSISRISILSFWLERNKTCMYASHLR